MSHDLPEETRATLDALTAEVVDSFAGAPDRLRELLQGLVGHLHAFVREHDLSQEEWRAAIDFLTRAGHITTGTRQEFILLSDTLGVSSLVDVLGNSRTPDSTPSAVLGPFYVEGPPELPDGADLTGDLEGERVRAEIAVTDTAGAPVAGAVVDVWQSDEEGRYDVQMPDLDGTLLRGRMRTDADGRLRFTTTMPAPYAIPDDGPVGQMLVATGRHPMRAAHVHFKIAAPGRHTLVTQLFVEGGDYLDSDTVFGVKDPIVVPFPTGDDGQRRLEFTFVLAEEQQ